MISRSVRIKSLPIIIHQGPISSLFVRSLILSRTSSRQDRPSEPISKILANAFRCQSDLKRRHRLSLFPLVCQAPFTADQLLRSTTRRHIDWIQRAGYSTASSSAAVDTQNDRSISYALTKLLPIAKPESGLLGVAIVLLFVSSAITMIVPLSMGTVIDVVLSENTSEEEFSTSDAPLTSPAVSSWKESLKENMTPSLLATVLVGLFITGGLANAGRVIFMRKASERIIARLRSRTFQRILEQDIAFHDKNRTGELISRLSTDTALVGSTLTNNISDGLRSIVMSVAGVSAMVFVNLQLTLTMMAIVPPIAFLAVGYGRFVRKLAKKTLDASAELTKLAEEKISNLRTVRAFSREGSEIAEYKKRVQDIHDLGIKEGYASAAFFGSTGASGNLVMLMVLYYGSTMVQSGLISVGDLTSFFLYTAYVGTSLIGLTTWYSELNKGIGASVRLFDLMESKPQIHSSGMNYCNCTYRIEPTNASTTTLVGHRLDEVQGRIRFSDVRFAYPTRQEATIFDGLTFEVRPGENVAIVGHSGSGKSTIAQLLLRFYDPKSGSITIDDHNLKSLDMVWLRDSIIGLVSQEPILFATSILENIRYGCPTATLEDVQRVAKLANAHSFITALPEGYETFVGERGHALSGGQKQRIAIARALLKNPRVLVLDEATSALDSASEKAVQEAIDRLVQGRTVITIAHRLSTIQKADRIVVIEQKRVVETGTFHELTEDLNSSFRKLVQSQLVD